METELYTQIQALMTLIERTDFTRQVSVSLDMGNSMLGFVGIVVIISTLLGFMLGSAYQEKKDEEEFKTEGLIRKYEVMLKEPKDDA